MQIWFLYALIAAVFIGIKDMMTKDLSNRYSYVEYIIIANIFVFIITLIYIFTMKPKLKRPNVKDGLFIFLRICIVLLIIEPSSTKKWNANTNFIKMISFFSC